MDYQPAEREQQVRLWGMFLHLSQLLNFLVPIAGVVVPIIIWQVKKTDLPELDAHGKIVVNWILSSLIYFFVSFLLVFLFIGFILLPVVAVLNIVFPIIGGVKANSGEIWKYPLTITFFR